MSEKSLKSQVLSGMFWRFGERICAQVVTFIVSIVLARLLEPSHYGVISLITVFITIANVFVTDGFGKALVQKKNVDDCDYSSVFYFNILFSWIIYFIVFCLAEPISKFYNEPILVPTLRVLAIKIPLAGINSVQQAYVSKQMLFKRFFWATLIGTIISAVVGIAMAVRGYGVWALVAQYLINSFVDTVILWITVKWRPKLVFSFSRLKELIKFGWRILLTSLINSAYDNLRSLIIGKAYSSQDLAFYTKGIHYPNLIISNVNTSISSVLFPALSKIQDDKQRLKASMSKAIAVNTYIIFPLMAGLAAVAPNLVSWMLTDKWLPCVPFMRIGCVYLALYPINITNLQAILATGKSDIYLHLNIIKKIVGITSVLVTIPFGVKAMAASEIVVGIIAIITNVSANKKLFGYSAGDLFNDIFKNFIISITMYITILFCDRIIKGILAHTFIILLVEILIGVAFYVSCSILFKSKEFKYILGIIRKKK